VQAKSLNWPIRSIRTPFDTFKTLSIETYKTRRSIQHNSPKNRRRRSHSGKTPLIPAGGDFAMQGIAAFFSQVAPFNTIHPRNRAQRRKSGGHSPMLIG
jgi:hypothetical protein